MLTNVRNNILDISWYHNFLFPKYHLPPLDAEASEGILEANENSAIKYIAQITLSAATPAAITDGDTPSASQIAT